MVKFSEYLNRHVFVMVPSDICAQRRFRSVRTVWSDSSLGAFWIACIKTTFMRTTKSLIRLRGCEGWFEFLLGAHFRRYGFLRCDSNREFFNSFGAKFQTTFVVCFFILTNYRLKRCLYVKLKDWMSNSVDPDETTHWAVSSGFMLFAKAYYYRLWH